jgi:hypothetical protein
MRLKYFIPGVNEDARRRNFNHCKNDSGKFLNKFEEFGASDFFKDSVGIKNT